MTLKPDRVFPGQYQDERIGLYFTEFDLPYCGAANITLFDGPDTYYSIVKGNSFIVILRYVVLSNPVKIPE